MLIDFGEDGIDILKSPTSYYLKVEE